MENERGRVIKVFRAAALRSFCTPSYWFKIVTVILLAAVSPYILEQIVRSAALTPPQVLEAFRQGNSYNIGILAVPALSEDILTHADEIVTGVISGSVTQCIAVFAAVGALSKEFSGGYVKLAIMHGAKRSTIYAKYMGLAALISLPVIVISPLCVFVSLSANYNLTVEKPSAVLTVLVVQAVMLAALVICFAGISFSLDGRGSAMIVIIGVFALPIIPHYLEIFTGGKIRIDGFLLISRLVSSGADIASHAAGDLITAVITAALFYFSGLMLFLFKNYK